MRAALLDSPCYKLGMSALSSEAARNVRDTLAIALEHAGERAALLVADERCELSRLLAAAYAWGR